MVAIDWKSRAEAAEAKLSAQTNPTQEALVRALTEVVRVSKSGADTVSFLVDLQRVAALCAQALASIPAQEDREG